MNATLNKRERRAVQLLKHYETCEALGRYLGMEKPDGKKISVALFKAEQAGQRRALRTCNDNSYEQEEQGYDKARITQAVEKALGVRPPGFFVNSDPRGYALKIDNEMTGGKKLIEAVKLHTDWGGYGILSPEINGN